MSQLNFFEGIFSLKFFFPFRSKYRGGGELLFAVWVLFMFTFFSGSIRKWYFGPGPVSNFIFLFQLLMPFIFYFLSDLSSVKPNFKTHFLYIFFVVYLILTAVNPMNETLYHGLFGLIIYLGFWVGLTAYYRRRDSFEIEKMIGLLIVILVIEVGLGSLQYSLPQSHILNIQVDGKSTDALVGGSVRVAGTFSYLGGYQVMVTFYGFLVWALLVLEAPFWVILSVFGLSFYAALISGSRGSTLILLVTCFFAFFYSGFLFKRLINVVLTSIIFIGLSYNFGETLLTRFSYAYKNFENRVEEGQETGESEGRFVSFYDEVINFRGEYPIYGIGLGSSYQGAIALFGASSYLREYGYIESELTRIILEGGFILLILRAVMLILFLRASYIPPLGQVVIFVTFHISMVVFNVFQGIFFLLGLILVDRVYYLQAKKNNSPGLNNLKRDL